MAKDPYRYFRVEAHELIEQLAKGVLDLEKDSAGAGLVLRLAHTLKGAARVVRQVEIADLAHRMEDALAPHRDGGAALPRERVDSVLAALDAIAARLAQLPLADGAKVPPAAGAAIPDAPARMGRADVAEVDILLEGLGEIGSELAGVRRSLAAVEQARDVAAQFAGRLDAAHGNARSQAEQVHGLIAAAERKLAAGVERIDRELRQARDAAERLRLIPVAGVFNALERSVRDAAYSVGKQVTFEAHGGAVRIDGEVLDILQGALVQLVRNAVAHGIESEAERVATGKAPAGRVTVEVALRGYRAWFRCSDDGRGVDLDAVRRVVQERSTAGLDAGLDTRGLDAAALLALLLKGGISTASAVTELAGRGVGLDVVRAAVQRLHGEVVAETVSGAGTTIELRVPLSLASLDVLLVEAGGQVAALPVDAVRRTVRVAPQDIVRSPEGDAIVHEGKLIAFLPLTLGAGQKERDAAQRAMTAVILAADDGLTAVAVKRLRGIDTVVLRPLPALAPADPLVLGMYLDLEGDPCLVLDPAALPAALRRSRLAAGAPSAPLPILIVDDSLTTRMLESSILESAGFSVNLAASAEEGLEMARRNSYGLFLVDVEMPGMDGFGFIEATRADPVLRDVPSILVTSCDTPEHRRRGAAAGARAYIVKSEFDQADFLERVAALVQR